MPTGQYKRPTAQERHMALTDCRTGDVCWPWLGAVSAGYGSFRLDGRVTTAHRAAFSLFVRLVADREVVDHVCRNPLCVNPAHLEAVSHSENAVRGVGPGLVSARGRARTHCKRGHPLFGENLRRDARGHRMCKRCQAEKAAEWKAANQNHVNEMQRQRRAAA